MDKIFLGFTISWFFNFQLSLLAILPWNIWKETVLVNCPIEYHFIDVNWPFLNKNGD
jgi:hypothetical protein